MTEPTPPLSSPSPPSEDPAPIRWRTRPCPVEAPATAAKPAEAPREPCGPTGPRKPAPPCDDGRRSEDGPVEGPVLELEGVEDAPELIEEAGCGRVARHRRAAGGRRGRPDRRRQDARHHGRGPACRGGPQGLPVPPGPDDRARGRNPEGRGSRRAPRDARVDAPDAGRLARLRRWVPAGAHDEVPDAGCGPSPPGWVPSATSTCSSRRPRRSAAPCPPVERDGLEPLLDVVARAARRRPPAADPAARLGRLHSGSSRTTATSC